ADDAHVMRRGEPVGAVADRRGRAAEQPHLAGVRQRRAGGEIDEHLRCGLIEAGDRDELALRNPQVRDPQWAEGPVLFCHAGKFKRSRRHDPICWLTSSTMRLDWMRAATSIFP